MRLTRCVRNCSGASQQRRGFTLIETALTTVIIGVGVLAVLEAQQAFLERNNWSTSTSTSTYLANEIREMSHLFSRHDRFSGGIYFTTPGDPATFAGWGPELGELIAADLDDLDDLDGAVFGDATDLPPGFVMSKRYPGPINAFGKVIPETLYDGTTEMFDPGDGSGIVPVGMRGWTQIIRVEKVNPYNITQVVPHEEFITSLGEITRKVDRYPVRVTVTVLVESSSGMPTQASTSINWVVLP